MMMMMKMKTIKDNDNDNDNVNDIDSDNDDDNDNYSDYDDDNDNDNDDYDDDAGPVMEATNFALLAALADEDMLKATGSVGGGPRVHAEPGGWEGSEEESWDNTKDEDDLYNSTMMDATDDI